MRTVIPSATVFRGLMRSAGNEPPPTVARRHQIYTCDPCQVKWNGALDPNCWYCGEEGHP